MRTLFVTPPFERDLRSIPSDIREHADNVARGLCVNPSDPTLDAKKLRGIRPPMWRVRIGSYRLVYRVSATSITLHRIRHRREVYRGF